MDMSEKHSIAIKKRLGTTPEKISKAMSKLVKENRWDKSTVSERKKVGRKLVEARVKKYGKKTD